MNKKYFLKFDEIILFFCITLFIYIIYPLYNFETKKIFFIQEFFIILFFLIFIISKRMVLHKIKQPFIEEFISSIYLFLLLILVSLSPYFIQGYSVINNAIFWNGMGSVLISLVYFIWIYPTFLPKTRESLEYLIKITLELVKLSITLWILIFLITSFYIIFGDIEFTFYEIILFGIAMIFYIVGCMGVLMLKIFGLFNKLDDYILNKK